MRSAASQASAITEDSGREQKGAGLDALSREEFTRFAFLNERYRAQFGFPFIFAVKGATKHQILSAFEDRIANSRAEEFHNALSQVSRILRFRLEDRIEQ
jgi:2-oxo-4-hydroxy-4-carboxy-5-ureidoimidazoline decarboxylase